MEDYRLVPARRIVWDKDAWREPARIGLAIRGLQQILADPERAESWAEAEMLIRKLYTATKKPAVT